MSGITQVVKALCSIPRIDGSGTAIPLAIDPATLRSAFAAVLDGGASDLETGALMAASTALEAQRTASWFAEIVLGLGDAIRDRMTPLVVGASSAPAVVLPNYGDDGAFPAIPLVALLLQRMGVRVLVHGAVETHGGLLNCSVFREFGVPIAATRGQAERQFAESGLALLPVTLFSPGLAAMLSLRNRLGIRTPAHALANMLMPVLETSTRLLHVIHIAPWLRAYLADESVVLETPALLVAPAESCSDEIERRAFMAFHDGKNGPGWQTLFDSECMLSPTKILARAPVCSAPALHEPRASAAWTRQRLEGKAELPLRVANLFACCLYGCGHANDIHQARAFVATEPGRLAVAAAT